MRRGLILALKTCLIALPLLLMALALVETPEMRREGRDAPPLKHPMAQTAILPAPCRQPAPESAMSGHVNAPSERAFALAPTKAGQAPARAVSRDANGHVIRHKRFVTSVYQTFRQHTACG